MSFNSPQEFDLINAVVIYEAFAALSAGNKEYTNCISLEG